MKGSTLDDKPCLSPDVRRPGEAASIWPIACAAEGDVVAVVGGRSTARAQLPEAPTVAVQIAHGTTFDEAGQFFFADPSSGEETQVYAFTELAVEVPADGALGYLPSWNGDLVTYAATGWLADAGFGVGSRLVTMATAASASPALSFVACELVEELHCVEVAAPP